MNPKTIFDALKREGECWHEWLRTYLPVQKYLAYICQKCGRVTTYKFDEVDFSTWSGFGWAIVRCTENDIDYKIESGKRPDGGTWLIIVLTDRKTKRWSSWTVNNPDDLHTRFITALGEFLEGGGDE